MCVVIVGNSFRRCSEDYWPHNVYIAWWLSKFGTYAWEHAFVKEVLIIGICLDLKYAKPCRLNKEKSLVKAFLLPVHEQASSVILTNAKSITLLTAAACLRFSHPHPVNMQWSSHGTCPEENNTMPWWPPAYWPTHYLPHYTQPLLTAKYLPPNIPARTGEETNTPRGGEKKKERKKEKRKERRI